MACSESARSGELGKAVVDGTLVARLTQWTVNPTASETTWGDSDSAGYTNRKKARLDCTGTIEGKFDDDNPVYDLFDVGDSPKLVLWENATDYWVFPCCLIQKFSINYNQDTKEVVGWTADFGSDGIFYRPGQAGAPSETLPA